MRCRHCLHEFASTALRCPRCGGRRAGAWTARDTIRAAACGLALVCLLAGAVAWWVSGQEHTVQQRLARVHVGDSIADLELLMGEPGERVAASAADIPGQLPVRAEVYRWSDNTHNAFAVVADGRVVQTAVSVSN